MPADCQDVELDMTTFTPEVKLQLAKVTANQSGLTLTKFRRPLPVYEMEEGYEGEDFDEEGEMVVGESEEEEAEVVEISLEDLHRDGERYRFVPNIMALALAL